MAFTVVMIVLPWLGYHSFICGNGFGYYMPHHLHLFKTFQMPFTSPDIHRFWNKCYILNVIIFCKTERSSWSLSWSATCDNCEKPVSASLLVTNVWWYQFWCRAALQHGDRASIDKFLLCPKLEVKVLVWWKLALFTFRTCKSELWLNNLIYCIELCCAAQYVHYIFNFPWKFIWILRN